MTKRKKKDASQIFGAQGGRKAAAAMTEEQRVERAKKAAAARWAKRDGDAEVAEADTTPLGIQPAP